MYSTCVDPSLLVCTYVCTYIQMHGAWCSDVVRMKLLCISTYVYTYVRTHAYDVRRCPLVLYDWMDLLCMLNVYGTYICTDVRT